jgi:hypothetical protein
MYPHTSLNAANPSPPTYSRVRRRLPSAPRTLAWDRASEYDRLAEAYRIIHQRGGKVFTLRLTLDAQISVTGSADPARTMSRRIQKAFKRAGLPAPTIAFGLEVTRDDRNELHLHGAIVLGDMCRDDVINALRDAAGRISGRAGSRQVQIKNFDLENGGPEGWAKYVKKGAVRTARVNSHNKLTYMDMGLRKVAKLNWELRRGQRVRYDA